METRLKEDDKKHQKIESLNIIKETQSICPECKQVIPATIYEEGGRVFFHKMCPEHGEYNDLYWGDYELYKKVEKYAHDGVLLDNPRTRMDKGCPRDCGICPNHKSTTTLGIIDITNRCNLRCPICFAHAGAAGYLYEPSLKQIREMMENLMANSPVWTPALQLSGGEPTVRGDLPEILEMAHEIGFVHVEVDSNGIRMSESVDYCRELVKAGMDTVYLQFDGVTPKPYIVARGFNLFPIKRRVIENLRSINYDAAVLVPVLMRGVNDDQVGDIIRFAIENRDVVRGVNFQPVAITGRTDKGVREKRRITISDIIRLTDEQTDGFIKPSDWFPVPSIKPLSDFMSMVKNSNFVDFSTHPHCGMGTYLYFEGDEIRPLTSYVDVEKTLTAIEKANEKMRQGKELRAKIEIAKSFIKNIKFGSLARYLTDVIRYSNYRSLNDIHHSMVLIGCMHFMDPYNFDLDRVQRCVIHYAVPDGRIIPFCSMNNIHRETVEKMYAQPLSANKVTPIYDVAALVNRISMESQHTDARNRSTSGDGSKITSHVDSHSEANEPMHRKPNVTKGE